MSFDKVMDILYYALPIIATMLGAKVINKNSLHWTVWNSRIAKIVGLLVSVLDALRSPKKYVNDVAPDKVKRKVVRAKNASLLLIPFILFPTGLPGCAAFQFGGDTWQESAYNTIQSVQKGLDVVEKLFPVWVETCRAIDDKDAQIDCAKSGLKAAEVAQKVDDALALARFAVSVGDESDFERQIDGAITLMRDIMRQLNEWGVF